MANSWEHRSVVAGAGGAPEGGAWRNLAHRFVLPAIFSSMFALFLPSGLYGIGIFDEGFILTGAMQVLQGKLPYRDFYSLYGPSQFYLTALLFAVFGETLLVAHLAHTALLAALAVILFKLAGVAQGRRQTLPWIVVLVYAGLVLWIQPTVGYPAISAVALLLISAFLVGRWGEFARLRTLAAASALVGVAGTFRWDFGIYGLLSLGLVVATVVLSRRARSTEPTATAISAIGPAVTIMLLVYVPFLILFSDPLRWYEEVLRYSFVEFSEWRNLEYVRPVYWSFARHWEAGNLGGLERTILELMYVVLPLALAFATVAREGLQLVRHGRVRSDRATAQAIMLGLLTLFLLNQMRIRPHLWQGFPALVSSLALVPYLLGVVGQRIGTAVRGGAGLVVLIFGGILMHVAYGEFQEVQDPSAIPFNTSRAGGVRVESSKPYYPEMVERVRSMTADGEAIYSGALDHSRLFINDCILYFLVARAPADRFTELEPGLANTRAGQQEIIDSLRQKDVRVVVLLDTSYSNEPNRTSTSNGVRDLDEYLSIQYHAAAQFGPYTVLEAK